MEIKDIFPADGRSQRIHCAKCGSHCELAFKDFDETVSGVHMRFAGLPTLRCPKCGQEALPDRSRMAIIETHRRALEQGSPGFQSKRKKIEKDFGFTKVKFLYDADDYYYIPGLYRQPDDGFLTPVFFNRAVLLKYDNAPGYRVTFASTTYGQIETESDYISFGINRFGHVVMWLGDIAKLPESEQYYLRSENIASDHALGSEFYEGQIEAVFTPKSREDELFALRSDVIGAFFKRFGEGVAHLEAEVMDVALAFNPPVVDTDKERRHVADALNKIYVESWDNAALGRVFRDLGGDPKQMRSLKLVQGILERVAPAHDVAKLVSPLYVLYDLRVAYSHLMSDQGATDTLEQVMTRLSLPSNSGLMETYDALVAALGAMFGDMKALLASAP